MQRLKAETKTAGGIFLPESAQKELNEARVLAVGPGGLDKDGKRIQIGVKEGDRVLIPTVSFLLRMLRRRVRRAGEGIEIRKMVVARTIDAQTVAIKFEAKEGKDNGPDREQYANDMLTVRRHTHQSRR